MKTLKEISLRAKFFCLFLLLGTVGFSAETDSPPAETTGECDFIVLNDGRTFNAIIQFQGQTKLWYKECGSGDKTIYYIEKKDMESFKLSYSIPRESRLYAEPNTEVLGKIMRPEEEVVEEVVEEEVVTEAEVVADTETNDSEEGPLHKKYKSKRNSELDIMTLNNGKTYEGYYQYDGVSAIDFRYHGRVKMIPKSRIRSIETNGEIMYRRTLYVVDETQATEADAHKLIRKKERATMGAAWAIPLGVATAAGGIGALVLNEELAGGILIANGAVLIITGAYWASVSMKKERLISKILTKKH